MSDRPDPPPCCGASRRATGDAGLAPPAPGPAAASGRAPDPDAVRLPGGIFRIGSDDPTFPADGEGPVRRARVKPFRIGRCAVTNREFRAFVDATDHTTDAERYGWSFVFHAFLPEGHPPTRAVPAAPWWRQVFGAAWNHPEGPDSTLDGRDDHPVVHVSWHDAVAYAAWAGGRLPTEAEWEYAARGGLDGARYPWGDELTPGGEHRCNIWQGEFPVRDTGEDGWRGTAPVGAFEPNGYGLHNTAGNVWEWCRDWFGATERSSARGALDDPQGPPSGPGRVTKGGSYLCHASYCNRYRVAARTHNTPDSTTGHMGFRVVWPA